MTGGSGRLPSDVDAPAESGAWVPSEDAMCDLDRVSAAQVPGCTVASMRALVHDLCHLDQVAGRTPAERLWNTLGRHDRMVYLTGSITLLALALLCVRWALRSPGPTRRAAELLPADLCGYGYGPGYTGHGAPDFARAAGSGYDHDTGYGAPTGYAGYGAPAGYAGYGAPAGYAGYAPGGAPPYGARRPWAHPPPPALDADGYPIGWQPLARGVGGSDYGAQRADA